MMATLFHDRPRLTVLAILLVLVAGWAGFATLPRLEDPLITSRFASIKTDYPGASAEQVDSQVVDKLESALFEVEEIQEIKSVSRTGFSEMVVILDDDADKDALDAIWSRVRDKLSDAAALLPARAGTPAFRREQPGAHTFVVALSWNPDTPPARGILTRLAKDFQRAIGLMPGTQRTDIYGVSEEEIRVVYPPDALAAAGLTPAAVAQAIADADVKLPAGQLTTPDNQMPLSVTGPLDGLDRVRGVPLSRLDDGRMLRVGDVARVTKSVRDPAATEALVNGRPAVIVAAMMSGGWRVDDWSADARAVLAEFSKDLPADIGVDIVFDQSTYVTARLEDLGWNLVMSLVLVAVVVCLTMGWRSGLVVGCILPLAIAMVVGGLWGLRIPLHQVSITGLIIALGMLIDNAIVMVDEFDRRRAEGMAVRDAIADSVRHLFVPLLASTVTTMLTFAPIALFPGPTGEFVGGLGTSVILSVGASLLLTLTVIPALAGRLAASARPASSAKRRGFPESGIDHPMFGAMLRGVLGFVVRRPVSAILLAVLPAVAGFALAGQLKQQFFPPTDRDQFQMMVALRPQATLEETRRTVDRVRAILAREKAVVGDTWVLGSSPPRVFYNVTVATDRIPSAAAAFIDTTSPEATREMLPRLRRTLAVAIPEAEVLVLPFEQGPLFDAPVEVEIYGPDLATLREVGDEVRLILGQSVNVTNTRATLAGGRPKLAVDVDEDVARMAGFDLSDVARQLSDGLDGATGGSIVEDTEELSVRVQAEDRVRGSPSRIADMPLATMAGAATRTTAPTPSAASPSATSSAVRATGVPLDALGKPSLVPTYGAITRYQGERVNRIQAFIEPFAVPSETLEDFKRRLDAAGPILPAGYRIGFGGEQRESGKSQAGLLAMVGPLVVLMTATVVLAFNSFRMAAVIAAVAVLSAGMGLFAVWVFREPLGFMTILGSLGLIGIAINDSIVVLAALREDPKACAGDREAIRRTVSACSRHVTSTTLTTVAGFVPLIIWGGSFWQPLAIAIAGGVSGATMLALVFVPAVFALMTRTGGVAAPVSPRRA